MAQPGLVDAWAVVDNLLRRFFPQAVFSADYIHHPVACRKPLFQIQLVDATWKLFGVLVCLILKGVTGFWVYLCCERNSTDVETGGVKGLKGFRWPLVLFEVNLRWGWFWELFRVPWFPIRKSNKICLLRKQRRGEPEISLGGLWWRQFHHRLWLYLWLLSRQCRWRGRRYSRS